MDKLFIAVRDKILTDVTGVKKFDWDNGELDGENPTPPVVPLVLMDIANIDFVEAGQGLDMGEMTITLKCGFRIRGRSDSNAPDSQQTTALEFIDTLKKIGVAARGLSSDNTSPLQRVNMQRIPTDELKVYEFTFACQYYEEGNIVSANTTERPPLEVTEK